jgi:hypothetical protein
MRTPAYVSPPPTGANIVFLARGFEDIDGDGKISEFARAEAWIPNAPGEMIGMPGLFTLDKIE